MSAVQNIRRRGQGAPMTGSSYQKEPENNNRLVPNKYLKNVGDKLRFRILELTSDSSVSIRTKSFKTKGFGKMAGKMMPTDLHWQMYKGEGRSEDDLIKGHDFDDPSLVVHMYELDDTLTTSPLNKIGVWNDAGDKPIGRENVIYRLGIYAYDVEKSPSNPRAKPTIEVLDLPYFFEINEGIYKQIIALKDTQGGDFAFDENTLTPEYDIYLIRNAEQGADTWKVEGIKARQDDKGKWIPDENYNVPSEDVFGDRFDEIWDALTGPIYQSMQDDFQKLDNIKYKIGPRKKAAGDATTPIASKPTMPDENPVEDAKENRRGGESATTAIVENEPDPVDDDPNADPEDGQTVKFGATARAGRRR